VAQAIIRRQSIIVDRNEAEAIATLPALLKTPQERSRLLALLDRLLANMEIAPEAASVVDEVRQVLAVADASPSLPRGEGAQVVPFPLNVA